MKKLFLVIGLMTSVIFCNAQSTYEPEFIGETNLLCISGSDTISMALDKENAKIKSKAGASLYLTGIGSVKTRIHVEGNTSSCVAKPDCAYRLVVRSANNDTDPNTFIQLIQFEVKKNERRCEIGRQNGMERVLICSLLILLFLGNMVYLCRIQMQGMKKG